MARRAALVLLAAALAVAVADADEPPLVAVDAGHTRTAPGAISARGVPERVFNLAVARKLVHALRAEGLRAVLLEAEAVPAAERPARAAQVGAAALVSIHHDSVQPRYLATWRPGASHLYSDRFHGFSVFYSEQSGAPASSLALAQTVARALRDLGLAPTLHHAQPIPGEGRTLVDPALGLYRFDELAVLRHARMPAILVECGVIVNRGEELLLADDAGQRRTAGAIARAVRMALAAGAGEPPRREMAGATGAAR